MTEKVKKTFTIDYELDILNKKISVNGLPEKDLKDFLDELKRSNDFLAKMLYNNIIQTAITEMRVMAWTGMDIKEWLKSVGHEE